MLGWDNHAQKRNGRLNRQCGGYDMRKRFAEALPRLKARTAGIFCSFNMVTSLFAFSSGGRQWAAAAFHP